MKLPNQTVTAAPALQSPESPEAAARKAMGPASAISAGLGAASEAYEEISNIAVSRAETKTRKEYIQQWGELSNRDSISVAELEDMGVEYDPNLTSEATVAGPDGSTTTARVVPTWAVAEAAHKKLVADLQQRNRPTATDAAARRFDEDFDLKYATEEQARVSEWATSKRKEYQLNELQDSVQDALEVGEYGMAQTVLNRAYAGGLLDDTAYRNAMDGVMEVKERSGYVNVIENGDLGERQRLLDELLEGIQPESDSYNGELIVEERQKYINQLQAVIKAELDGSSDKSMAGLYLQQAKDAFKQGDQWGEALHMQASSVIMSQGNARQQTEWLNLRRDMADQELLFRGTVAQTDAALSKLEANAGRSLEDSMRYEAALASVELKEKMLKQDPVRFVMEYGPATDAHKAASEAGAFDPVALMTEGPGAVRDMLNTRRVMMREGAGMYGSDKLILTKDEVAELQAVWSGSDTSGRLGLAAAVAQLGVDNSQAIFDQLSTDGTVDGYAFQAAGAALAGGSPDAARMIVQANAMSGDPQVQNYANQSTLRDQVRRKLAPGTELSMGVKGRENFITAVTQLYAYQASQQGLSPKSIDEKLLDASLSYVSGGQLTDYGMTRVRPPEGMSAAGMNSMFKRADPEFWQAKLDEGDYRFNRGSDWVDGIGLKQQLSSGKVWLANAQDGTGGYLLMHHRALPGGLTEPAIRVDADGEPVVFYFNQDDYVPTSFRPSGARRAQRRGD